MLFYIFLRLVLARCDSGVIYVINFRAGRSVPKSSPPLINFKANECSQLHCEADRENAKFRDVFQENYWINILSTNKMKRRCRNKGGGYLGLIIPQVSSQRVCVSLFEQNRVFMFKSLLNYLCFEKKTRRDILNVKSFHTFYSPADSSRISCCFRPTK